MVKRKFPAKGPIPVLTVLNWMLEGFFRFNAPNNGLFWEYKILNGQAVAFQGVSRVSVPSSWAEGVRVALIRARAGSGPTVRETTDKGLRNQSKASRVGPAA